MTPADQHARTLADRTVGATHDEIHADMSRTHHQLEAWWAAYHAAQGAGAAQMAEDTKGAADLLNCSEDRVRQLVAAGHLERVPNLGRTVRITRASIDRHLRGGK